MWRSIFNFQKLKKIRTVEQWELDLLKNTLLKLPVSYHQLIEQIDAKLIKTVQAGLGNIPHWMTFGFDKEIVSKYDRPRDASFMLVHIQVFDIISQKYLEYKIGCASGTLAGYSINCNDPFDIDLTNINTRYFQKRMLVPDQYNKIKKLFTTSELKLINPSDVYAVELGQKKIYHLTDLKGNDGDFLGIDDEKNIYRITHDPFEIKLLDIPLVQSLEENIDFNR